MVTEPPLPNDRAIAIYLHNGIHLSAIIAICKTRVGTKCDRLIVTKGCVGNIEDRVVVQFGVINSLEIMVRLVVLTLLGVLPELFTVPIHHHECTGPD